MRYVKPTLKEKEKESKKKVLAIHPYFLVAQISAATLFFSSFFIWHSALACTLRRPTNSPLSLGHPHVTYVYEI